MWRFENSFVVLVVDSQPLNRLASFKIPFSNFIKFITMINHIHKVWAPNRFCCRRSIISLKYLCPNSEVLLAGKL